MRFMTKWDKVLIIAIIILSISGLLVVKEMAWNDGTKYLVVTVNNREYKRFSLGKNMIGEIIDIDTEYGHNKIEIGDGKARIIESDCPDHLCERQGWISKPGHIAVCLPNRLFIEIISNDYEESVDDYSY